MKLWSVHRKTYEHIWNARLLPAKRERSCPQRVTFIPSSVPFLLCIPLALSCALTTAAKTRPAVAGRAHEQQEESAQQLVRDVVWNEVHAQVHDTSHWRFHETQWKGAARKVYDVIQTKYGDLHRLLAIDGQPLDGKALRAENKRIQKLCHEPQQVEQAQKARDDDAKQEQSMLEMLPNAFLFHEVGRQGDVVKLAFVPDPHFRPTTREAQVFHHMEGTMLVDGRQKRLVEINGELTTPVEFWGGVLGHLDAGGTFNVKQRDVGDGHWDVVYLRVNMNGKALFFKTISVQQREAYTDYKRVRDDITLAQAANVLKQDVESTPSRNLAGQ